MSEATVKIVDNTKVGKKGYPRFAEAFGRLPPMKTVPVLEDGTPDYNHPGLTPEQIGELEAD